MSALLATKKISSAAKLEIEGGDLESGAEVGKFFQCCEAAASDGSELDFLRDQQVGVGAPVGTADASTQLIKLGKPKSIGPVDQDGVAQRNVETVLDDRCRYQNIGLVMHELQHHSFELRFAHLAVANHDARLRG